MLFFFFSTTKTSHTMLKVYKDERFYLLLLRLVGESENYPETPETRQFLGESFLTSDVIPRSVGLTYSLMCLHGALGSLK